VHAGWVRGPDDHDGPTPAVDPPEVEPVTLKISIHAGPAAAGSVRSRARRWLTALAGRLTNSTTS
jgi:hypothetical protein